MIFGEDLLASSVFANVEALDAPVIPPVIPPAQNEWVEQCPTVSAWAEDTKQASGWINESKQGSTWNQQAKNITTTKKCDE